MPCLTSASRSMTSAPLRVLGRRCGAAEPGVAAVAAMVAARAEAAGAGGRVVAGAAAVVGLGAAGTMAVLAAPAGAIVPVLVASMLHHPSVASPGARTSAIVVAAVVGAAVDADTVVCTAPAVQTAAAVVLAC